MKKLILILLLAITLEGCITYSGFYNLSLQEVDRPENTKLRYGESKIINFEDEGAVKYRYEDELFKIIWIPSSTHFSFLIENKSEHSIKIIWDESVYIDINGKSVRVIHSGIRYIDKNDTQIPTVIPKKSSVQEAVYPTDKIYYESLGTYYGGWQKSPLFPNQASTKNELIDISRKFIGNTVKVLLPIQIQDVVNEYIFSFKIENFVLEAGADKIIINKNSEITDSTNMASSKIFKSGRYEKQIEIGDNYQVGRNSYDFFDEKHNPLWTTSISRNVITTDIMFYNGYNFDGKTFLGVGIGLEYSSWREVISMSGYYYDYYYNSFSLHIPVLGRLKANFTTKKVSPFLLLNLGYDFMVACDYPRENYSHSYKRSGVVVNPCFGIDINFKRNKGLCIYTGYHLHSNKESSINSSKNIHSASLKLGFKF